MQKESSQGALVANALKSDKIQDLAKEYGELGIDAALESGILKDIPIVNTVVAVFSAANTFRNFTLTKKVLRFLNELSSLTQPERDEMVRKLNEDDKFAGRSGTALIEILDRMESERKPEIAAKCFFHFAKGYISFEQLRRLLLAVERVPSFDVPEIRNYSAVDIPEALKLPEAFLLALANAGLAKNNGGYDGGALMPTELCKLFVKLDLDR